jgi:hypothetical protein
MKKVTTKDFIGRAMIKHNNKYCYSLVDYKHGKVKIKIICPEHGIFEQIPNNHMNGRGCPKCCTNTKLTKEEFIQKTKIVHGDKYDYSLVDYTGIKNKISIVCQEHGIFKQSPESHLSGSGCGKCANNIRFSLNEFIKKSNEKHNNVYNYSLVDYKKSKDKVKIICPIHGFFEQKASNHMRGDRCPSCTGNKRLTNDEFIIKAKETHGTRYDYKLVNYTNNSSKISIICRIHGEFDQQPNNHINGNGCPKCKESKGEKEIRKFLIENSIEFISQYRFKYCRNILPLPFDFYLPKYNTCIEFQGRQHYVPVKIWGGLNAMLDIQKRDKIKMEYCRDNNIPLIIVKHNNKVFNKLKKLINPKSHR